LRLSHYGIGAATGIASDVRALGSVGFILWFSKYFAEAFMVEGQSPFGMTTGANRPFQMTIVIDVRHKKIDRLFDSA
jgi:xylose isomerase